MKKKWQRTAPPPKKDRRLQKVLVRALSKAMSLSQVLTPTQQVAIVGALNATCGGVVPGPGAHQPPPPGGQVRERKEKNEAARREKARRTVRCPLLESDPTGRILRHSSL